MTLPRVPGSLWTERAGILAVAHAVNRLGLIWREQPSPDVGIDGQIELVDAEGRATGRIVAVQVKSGASYFEDGGDCWRFRAHERHRVYWEMFALPVLVMLHSPADGLTFWTDARQALRSAPGESRVIRVPKSSVLQRATATDLFYTSGGNETPLLPLPDLLRTLCVTGSGSSAFPLTYFDLFANGLTNGANALYFGMDLAMEVAESNISEEEWLAVGPAEHDFLFGYLRFVVEQNLANIDLSGCLVDWHDREKQPTLIAPLTSRGRTLVGLIHQKQREFERAGILSVPPDLALRRKIPSGWRSSRPTTPACR
jgi:hypothetical protein